MRWPWQREKREEDHYTAAAMAALLADAQGLSANVQDMAVAGACARIYATAMALARIEPAASAASMLLSARCRAYIGAQLALSGNAILSLESTEAGLMAVPATGYADTGNHDPATWIYTVDTSGPGTSYSRRRRGADLLHFRLDTEPRTPWRGVSPLRRAGFDAHALAGLSRQVAETTDAPHGWFMTDGAFEDEESLQSVVESYRTTRGRAIAMTRTVAAAQKQTELTQFGAHALRFDQGLQLLRRDMAAEVSAALGIPAALIHGTSGVQGREAWRQLGVYLGGIGELLAVEVAEKLDERVSFDFSGLAAADIRARAAAFKSLVAGGLSEESALRIVALDGGEREGMP